MVLDAETVKHAAEIPDQADLAPDEQVEADVAGDSSNHRPSKTKRYIINLLRVTSNHNPRNPLSDELKQMGWGVFMSQPGHEDKTPLWDLATSGDMAQMKQFVELIKDHDPELTALARNIYVLGQLDDIKVSLLSKDSKGVRRYRLVDGARRGLAQLWLWCSGLKALKYPEAVATFAHGNEIELGVISHSLNHYRKSPTYLEEALHYRSLMRSSPSTTVDNIAAMEGVAPTTVRRYLDFLELPPEQQEAILNKKVPFKATVEQHVKQRNAPQSAPAAATAPPTSAPTGKPVGKSPEGSASPAKTTERIKMRTKREIEDRLDETLDPIARAELMWVLGHNRTVDQERELVNSLADASATEEKHLLDDVLESLD